MLLAGCKKGGLVILCRNKIQDKLSDLASKALVPSAVGNEPKIYPSLPAEQKKDLEHQANPVIHNFHKNQGEDRGDVFICGLFWARRTDGIIGVHITDVAAKSNLSKDPDKVLTTRTRMGEEEVSRGLCLEQRQHFTPFVVSTNELLGKEAKTLLKKILALLAEKSEKLYSEVCGSYVDAHMMSIAIVV
jgi:hypothetical protein